MTSRRERGGAPRAGGGRASPFEKPARGIAGSRAGTRSAGRLAPLAREEAAHDGRARAARARKEREHLREADGQSVAKAQLLHPAPARADLLGDEEEERDDDHHRRDDPEVLGERPLDLLLEGEPDDADGQRAEEDEPDQLGLRRQAAPEQAAPVNARGVFRAAAGGGRGRRRSRYPRCRARSRRRRRRASQLDDGDDGVCCSAARVCESPVKRVRGKSVRRELTGMNSSHALHDADDDGLDDVHWKQ